MVEEEERMFWEERRRYEEEMEWFWRHGRDHRGPPMRPPFGPGGPPPHMMVYSPKQMPEFTHMVESYSFARVHSSSSLR